MADQRLRLAATHLMNVLVPALEAEGVDVPTRRYIHTGQIAHDFAGDRCVEAFVISWDAAFQGNLGAAAAGAGGVGPIRCAMPLSVQFTIDLLRCVPVVKETGAAPKVPDLQAAGEALMVDAWTLNAVIVEQATSGNLIDDTQHVTEVAIGGSLAIGPEGGAGGVTVQLFVGIL